MSSGTTQFGLAAGWEFGLRTQRGLTYPPSISSCCRDKRYSCAIFNVARYKPSTRKALVVWMREYKKETGGRRHALKYTGCILLVLIVRYVSGAPFQLGKRL